jgi:Co/Zn/Cd efflux system component
MMLKSLVTEPTIQFMVAVGSIGLVIAVIGLIMLNMGSAIVGQDLVTPFLAAFGG